MPIFDYDRSMGGTVIGGCVYRGSGIPSLYGQYVFGDFMSGRIWAIERQAESSQWQPRALLETGLLITSFGEDPDGELYVTEMSHGGLYRLAAAPSWPAEP